MDKNKLLERVNSLTWVHSIDLGNGIITPGQWGTHNQAIWKSLDEIDFRGKKVLDIGCWDGLWSFECEKRGAAEVYATDDISQRWGQEFPTFQLAHEILNSKVKYYSDVSVFDVRDKLKIIDFDVVLFCGIYYHLKNPLLALARLRSVMKAGGIIIVEGDVINGYEEAFARFYYHEALQDDVSNWWVPTIPCLRQWIECSYFEILKERNSLPLSKETVLWLAKNIARRVVGRKEPDVRSRHTIIAKAVCRHDPVYAYPDDDLKNFIGAVL